MHELRLIPYLPIQDNPSLRWLDSAKCVDITPQRIYWVGCAATGGSERRDFIEAYERGDLESLHTYQYVGLGEVIAAILLIAETGDKRLCIVLQTAGIESSETCLSSKEVFWEGVIEDAPAPPVPVNMDYSRKTYWRLLREAVKLQP